MSRPRPDRARAPAARRRRPRCPTSPAGCASPSRSCWCSAASSWASSRTCPTIELEPDLVFLLFLPPILFAAGVLHADPRLPGQPPAHPAAGDRARAVHDGRRRGRGLRRSSRDSDWPAALTLGRDRRAARRGRRHRRSSSDSASRAGSSRSSRARASSTTPRRSSPTGSRRPSPSASSASRSSTRRVEFVVVGVGGIAVGVVAGLVVTRGPVPDGRPDPRDRRLAHRPDRGLPRRPRSSACRACWRSSSPASSPAARRRASSRPMPGCWAGRVADRHLGHQHVRVHAHRAAAAVDHGRA